MSYEMNRVSVFPLQTKGFLLSSGLLGVQSLDESRGPMELLPTEQLYSEHPISIIQLLEASSESLSLIALSPIGLVAFSLTRKDPQSTQQELLWKWDLPQCPGLMRSTCVTLQVLSNGLVRVGTSDGLLYTLSKDGQEVYWTCTGDIPIQSLSMNIKKDYYMVSTLDGDVRFFKGPSCLGEIHFIECVTLLVNFEDSLSWIFGFVTDHWMGVYQKTQCLWKLKIGQHKVTSLTSFKSGEKMIMALGYSHGLIEGRLKETGDIVVSWNVDTIGPISALCCKNDRLVAVAASGKCHFFGVSEAIEKQKKSVADPQDAVQTEKEHLLNEIRKCKALLAVQQETRIRTHLECQTTSIGALKLILNIFRSPTVKSNRLLVRSSLLSNGAILASFPVNSLSIQIPLDVRIHEHGILDISLFVESNVKNESSIESVQVIVPEFSRCVLVTESFSIPPLVATVSWISTVFNPNEWIPGYFLSHKPVDDDSNASVLKWLDHEGRDLVMEFNLKKIRLYGDKGWVHRVAALLNHDFPGELQIQYANEQRTVIQSSKLDLRQKIHLLNDQVDNAHLCRYWEDLTTLNAQVYELVLQSLPL